VESAKIIRSCVGYNALFSIGYSLVFSSGCHLNKCVKFARLFTHGLEHARTSILAEQIIRCIILSNGTLVKDKNPVIIDDSSQTMSNTYKSLLALKKASISSEMIFLKAL
jgi:hypothetical protein